jgi:hypothetical protein
MNGLDLAAYFLRTGGEAVKRLHGKHRAQIVPHLKAQFYSRDSFKLEKCSQFVVGDNGKSLPVLVVCVRRVKHATGPINLR